MPHSALFFPPLGAANGKEPLPICNAGIGGAFEVPVATTIGARLCGISTSIFQFCGRGRHGKIFATHPERAILPA